ncbi:zinc finger BED domain-containing protein RICESLEEPER 2 [Glycine max]|uniref:zinc finger BED domain-containing protein RICESLEEPER 2 n=1 Tax=Glycine max TaxID=3847 RepID=UPI0007194591|nr:zinc finger BED domain-containing protein RICESLEEPER 2 [Glycine max]|eukprot:XP_014619056.1 zinc finger BED domain-containing protein RICESLEEPER 2 [Glycine max]
MSASTPMAGGNEDNKGNDVGKNTKQGAEAVIKKKRQKHQQFGMTFMKLKFLEWEKRLCAGWNHQKEVLSFMKVPAPRRGIDVADAIFKCLKAWGIEEKVFSVCCSHILNLLVEDGLDKIKDVIQNVRESVKYINHNDSRLKAFCDVAEQKHLKERKLIIDCPTRWNSAFQMLSTTLKFKTAFSTYSERDPHYTYAPLHEDWEKVQKVCTLLEVFNVATHVISGNEYPIANLCLAEVWRVKQVIDNALEDTTFFMREMAGSMRVKFDKYWGECNMLMSIASVLDPRCKFHVVNICFPLIYKSKEIAMENIEKVRNSLQQLYDEHVTLSINESSLNEMNDIGINSSTTSASKSSIVIGFDQIMNIVRANEATPPVNSELEDYLKENVYIPETSNSYFSVLEWWRNNSLKYKVLSKMAGDILAIPISTVVSESTFSAKGRVIDEYCSKLNEESIEALICRGIDFAIIII